MIDRIYHGIPYLSFFGNETQDKKIEKIYFLDSAFPTIYIKTFILDDNPINKKVVEYFENNIEVSIDTSNYILRLTKTQEVVGFAWDYYRFIKDNNLIGLYIKPIQSQRILIGFNYLTRYWMAKTENGIYKVGIGDRITLPDYNFSFNIEETTDAKEILEIILNIILKKENYD